MFDFYLSEEIKEATINYVNAPSSTVDKVATPTGTFHTFNIVKHDIYLSIMMLKNLIV